MSGDSPAFSTVPSHTAPLTYCTSSTLALTTESLRPAGVTPRPFALQWDAETATATRGVLRVVLDALTTNPLAATFTIGAPDQTTAGAFAPGVAGPLTIAADIDAAARIVRARSTTGGFSVHFSDANATFDIPVVGFTFQGTLDPTCARISAITIQLFIARDSGGIHFGPNTLLQLLGEPGDVVLNGKPVWQIVLKGS